MRTFGILAVAVFLILPCSLVAEPVTSASSDEALRLGSGASVTFVDALSSKEWIGVDYRSAYVNLVASLSMNNDKKYGADIANLGDGTFFGNYFLMEEGGFRLKGFGMTLEMGRFYHKDPVGGPYSLFVNSGGPSTPSARLRYENDFLIYESLWLELNDGSVCVTEQWPSGFPNRGANVKTYALKLADGMRFGFQDAAVYTGRSFDYEYFLSPVPQYFIQYVKGTEGRPWTTGANENNMIGAFWDWKTDRARFSAQTLMDDFNIHFLAPDTPNNPWKAAWALDANFNTDVGVFGFHHAGATKHTFQPSIQDTSKPGLMAYSYTYYPDVRYKIGSEYSSILIEDNMIGYRNGENNLAFMADWRGRLAGMACGASLEYVASGAKSPANPWHELYGQVDYSGTKVIADERLEHRVLLTIEAKKAFGAFEIFGQAKGGYVFNELALSAPGGSNPTPGFTLDDIPLFKPSDSSRPLYSITIGGSIDLDLLALVRPSRNATKE